MHLSYENIRELMHRKIGKTQNDKIQINDKNGIRTNKNHNKSSAKL